MNTFQTGLLLAFGFLVIVAVLVFSGVLPGAKGPNEGIGGVVVVWGPYPTETVDTALREFKRQYEKEFTLTYVAKNPATLEQQFVEALAAGEGPDLVILPHTSLLRQQNKLVQLPYTSLPERTYTDTFLRAGALYLDTTGIWALPFAVDPLVLYYNVDRLSAARLAAPPTTWAELQTQVPSLSTADRSGNLLSSAIPLGNFGNINHAKDILALLIMQTGNPIVSRVNDGYQARLGGNVGGQTNNASTEALGFFHRFSDPANPLYSWNAAQPEARDAFVRGQTAFYLGYASELPRLRQQNPQLNLDAASVPQLSASAALTFGRLDGLSLVRGSRNAATAVRAAYLLTSKEASQALVPAAGLVPARIDILRILPPGAIEATFYQAAIMSRAWLDPDPERTREIFRAMSDSIRAGAQSPESAIGAAVNQLNALLANFSAS
jgi:ABC-type glycerol-3-phosphate transport system substrate-binding protein